MREELIAVGHYASDSYSKPYDIATLNLKDTSVYPFQQSQYAMKVRCRIQSPLVTQQFELIRAVSRMEVIRALASLFKLSSSLPPQAVLLRRDSTT